MTRRQQSSDGAAPLRAQRIVPISSIGKQIAHESAQSHVTGAATYIDDIREPHGCIHLAPGYAPNAVCGEITKIDLSAVEAFAGVITVLTASDIPGINDCSPSLGDDPILADKRIEFHGQVIFAVVAETREIARRAARLAKITVDGEAPIISAADGHKKNRTVLPDYEFVCGAPPTSSENRSTAGETFQIGGQEHFYLEGQVSLAIPTEKDEFKVLCSTQHPSEVQHIIAEMLGLSDAAITCECRRMGGAFGGKESQAVQWAALAALAAWKTGRPAKMRLDRDDDMIMTGKRHDAAVDWRAQYAVGGRLEHIDVLFKTRCGCSADLSAGVNDRIMFHADNAYFYPSAKIKTRRIKTNTVSNTAFRGFGGPQGVLFAERLMDVIAIKEQLDPLVVRKENIYGRHGNTTPYGMKVDDQIALSLIEELEQSSRYAARRSEIAAYNKSSRTLKRGIALTPVKFGISFTLKHLNQAGALIHVYGDGSVQLNHGGTEMGQGLYTKVAQIVADEFGVDLKNIKITATATDKVPNASPTAASSGTDLNGMAAQIAARTIKGRMAELAAQLLRADIAEVEFNNGRVTAGANEISFSDLAKKCILERISLSSTGFYTTPKLDWNRDTQKGRPFLYFAYGAACSEVIIDTLTGEMRVLAVDILHDVGRSLNPAIDTGQIEGGFVQGMGWLTTEELVFDDVGRLRTHAPSTYKIPTATDVPEHFKVELWESLGNTEDTIHRSKAVGEPPVMLACSVFSAITHAIASIRPGVVPALNAPATPEEILCAVRRIKACA